jgi:hypothetical protein
VRRGFPGRVDQPETINFTEPPSKLLSRLYKNNLHRTYKKIVDGRELFERSEPEIAYNKCSKLKALLDEMLQMAQNAMTS